MSAVPSPATRRYPLAELEEWQKLLRFFDLSEGFAFVPVSVTDSEGAIVCRDSLADHLAQNNKQLVVWVLAETTDAEKLANWLLEADLPANTGAFWLETVVSEFAPEFQGWREAWVKGVALLNQHRNLLRARFKVPVLFVGADWLPEVIRENAPDLWSIRTLCVHIEARPAAETEENAPAENISTIGPTRLIEPEDAPNPDMALQQAEKLRGREGSGRELMEVLRQAIVGLITHDRMAEAETTSRELLNLAQGAKAPLSTLAAIHALLANTLRGKDRLQEAEQHLRRAVVMSTQQFGEQNTKTLDYLERLVQLLVTEGKLEDAEHAARRVFEVSRRLKGDDSPQTLASLNNLANVLTRKGDLIQAEELHREALRRAEALLGLEHPDTLASVNNLGAVLREKGDLDAAEALYRRAAAGREKMLGPEHPDTARSLASLAIICIVRRHFVEAEALLQRALHILVDKLGPKHPDILRATNTWSQWLVGTGRLDEAEEVLRGNLATAEETLGPEHVLTLSCLNNLGPLLIRKQDWMGAEAIIKRGLEAAQRRLGNGHPLTKRLLFNLEQLQQAKSKYPEPAFPAPALNDQSPKL